MLGGGQGRDLPLNVRIDALVDRRHSDGVADQPEGGAFDGSDIDGGVPSDGQAEPEIWLVLKGTAVTANIAVTCAARCSDARPKASVEA